MVTERDRSHDDAEAMERLRAGQMDALGEIYLRHADRVMAVTARVVPELAPEDVEDICQEVFLSLPDLAGHYEEKGRLGSWLIGVAVRMARNRRRKRWLRSKLLQTKRIHVPGPTAMPAPDGTLEKRDMARAFARLSQKDREVLVLSVVEGLDGAQIGEILGMKPGSVWSRLHRARRALAKELARAEAARR